MVLASGSPFDILEGFDSQNNDGIWARPNLVPDQKLSVVNQGPSEWFNTAVFTPSILMQGNSPRNPVAGPGTHALNLTLMK